MQATPHLHLVRSTDNNTPPQTEPPASEQQDTPAQRFIAQKARIKQILKECTTTDPTPSVIEKRLQGIEQQLHNILRAVQQKGTM